MTPIKWYFTKSGYLCGKLACEKSLPVSLYQPRPDGLVIGTIGDILSAKGSL